MSPRPGWAARGCALLTVALLAGCAGPTRTAAPIETRGGASTRPSADVPRTSGVEPDVDGPAAVADPGEAQLALARPAPPSVRPAPPSRSAAVRSLLASAMQSGANGDWDRAQSALERALKLAPSDAGLWRQLAYSQYRLGAYDEAAETAGRALAVARSHSGDPAPVWALIADIEEGRGNAVAARDARSRGAGTAPP